MEIKLDKDGWPLDWDILSADDMCRGAFRRGDTCCTTGWMRMNLYGSVDRPRDVPSSNVTRELLFRHYFLKAAKSLSCVNRSYGAIGVNDCDDNSLDLIARANNLTAAMLGYVVNNPETKTLKRMEA